MPKLPEYDFMKQYNHDFKNLSFRHARSMGDVLNYLEKSDNPFDTMNWILTASQIYTNAAIEEKRKSFLGSYNKPEKKVLDIVLQSSKDAVVSLYSGEGVPTNTKEKLLSYEDNLVNYSRKERPHGRHLLENAPDVYKFFIHFQNNYEEKPDTLVAILSGGLEPGFLAQYLLDVDNLKLVRYCTVSKNDQEVHNLPYYELNIKDIKNKSVLIVDDIVANGSTKDAVNGTIIKQKPKSLKFIATNKKNANHI